MVPTIALEAVLWRPENEKMNVQSAIEELRQSSFIEIITKDGDEIINVPLAATIFGKGELEINPDKIKIMSDRELLMEFGTTTFNNLSSGLSIQIERKFKSISKRIKSTEEFENELPLLEYIASKYPKTYKYIIEVFEEYNDYDKIKYYLREYIKSNIPINEKSRLWLRLAAVCRYSKDWDGESHALTELIQLPNVNLEEISEAANRINNHFYHNMAAKRDEYKSEMLDLIIKIFTLKISEGNATDYSRLGWLLLNNNNQDEAKKMAEEGLKLDINNKYCNRLIEILE
jgi:tetratricopeptide (TPR) repeat protein